MLTDNEKELLEVTTRLAHEYFMALLAAKTPKEAQKEYNQSPVIKKIWQLKAIAENQGYMSLHDYYRILNAHDWFFEYTESSYYHKRGQEQQEDIQKFSKCSEAHTKLLHAFAEYINDETRQTPKPQLPEV